MSNKNNKSTVVAQKVMTNRQEANRMAEESKIKNLQGETKTITISPSNSKPYKITLRFPGVADGWRIIESDTKDTAGHIVGPAVLENAISAGMFVSPAITSIDYWNEHRGLYDVSSAVINFLTERLN